MTKPLIAISVVLLVAGGGLFGAYLAHRLDGRQQSESDRIAEGLVAPDGSRRLRRGHESGEPRETDLEAIRNLPYVTGSHQPAESTGVTVHDRARAGAGVNLFTSAHAPKAFLMDMNGDVLHQWQYQRDRVWPHLTEVDRDKDGRRYFRRVHLFENGDLLAIYEYTGIIRIDASSNLIWAHQGWNHHDLHVGEDGKIYVLGRDVNEHGRPGLVDSGQRRPPRRVHGRLLFDENITILTPDGELVERISIIDSILGSRFAPLLDVARDRPQGKRLDLLHANTVHVLDGAHAAISPAFKAGNILVSLRNLSTIAIIDPEAKQVVWALSNLWRHQHEPVLLENGHMLVFDNLAGLQNDDLRTPHYSRVVEFDPLTQEIFWEFPGDRNQTFFSMLMGSNQRLPNGNTLITESDYGRVLEVTPGGKVVWEFNNPHTVGENGQFAATIPEMIRLAAGSPLAEFADQAEPQPAE